MSLAISLLIILAIAYFILHTIFNGQEIHDRIIQTFSKQGYHFSSDGLIKKSWFPSPNISLYNISLTDNQSQVFTAERVNIRFSSAVLLGNKKIEKILFNKPEWFIKKQANGQWNVENLFAIHATEPNVPNRFVVSDGALNFEDGYHQYRMENIHITGDNMTDNGIIQGNGQWINKNSQNITPFQFSTLLNYQNNGLFMRDFSGSLKTQLPYFGETDVQWKLPHFRYKFTQNLIETGRAEIEGHAKNSGLSFNISDTGWQFNATDGNIESPQTKANFYWSEKDVEWKANVVLENSSFDLYHFQSKMKYNLVRKTPELIHTAEVYAKLGMDKNWQHIDLSNLNIQTAQSNIDNTHLLWQTNLSGNANYSIKDGVAKIYLSGVLDRQPLKMISQYNPKAEYAWQSKIALTALNLSPQTDISNKPLPTLKEVDQFLVELSKSLKYLGNKKIKANLNIDRLKLGGGQVNNFSAIMQADKNNAQWKDMQAEIYGGTLKGSLKMNSAYPPTYSINQDLANVNVGDLLYDTIGYPYFSGIGNVYVDLKMQGGNNTPAAIEGDTVIVVENGIFRGLNVQDLMKNNDNFSKQISNNSFGFNKNTEAHFSYFTMLTHWKNGIGETPAAIFKGEMFDVEGKGTFDLNNQTMDYNFSLVGQLSNQDDSIYLPLRITGKMDSPQYMIDYNAIVRDTETVEERQKAVQDLLQQQWNLFKKSTMD